MQPEELYELDTAAMPAPGSSDSAANSGESDPEGSGAGGQQPESPDSESPDSQSPDSQSMALLVYLEGFMDAGAAGRLLTEHLLGAFEHTTVARFNTDRLLDYRSRRPLMTFDDGKWETYDAPELSVFKLSDAEGKPFLLLTGPEPDHE